MRGFLLDTHAVLWYLSDDDAMPEAAYAAIDDSGLDVFVSTASLLEIAIKTSIGRLRVDADLPEQLSRAGIRFLPISAEHAWRLRDLPFHHRDPFDRLLVSQAIHEGLMLITGDEALAAYDVETAWS